MAVQEFVLTQTEGIAQEIIVARTVIMHLYFNIIVQFAIQKHKQSRKVNF